MGADQAPPRERSGSLREQLDPPGQGISPGSLDRAPQIHGDELARHPWAAFVNVSVAPATGDGTQVSPDMCPRLAPSRRRSRIGRRT